MCGELAAGFSGDISWVGRCQPAPELDEDVPKETTESDTEDSAIATEGT